MHLTSSNNLGKQLKKKFAAQFDAYVHAMDESIHPENFSITCNIARSDASLLVQILHNKME